MKAKKASEKSPSSTPVGGTIASIDFGVTSAEPTRRRPSKYPIFSGPGIAALVDKLIDLKRKFDAVDGPYKIAKGKLKELAFPEYFKINHGRMDPPSSLIAYGEEGETRITFKDVYTAGDQRKVEALLGGMAPSLMRQHWTVIIDSDLIPPEKGPELVTELQKLMSTFGLSSALKIKAGIVPVPGFSIRRHLLDVEMNIKLQELVPQQAMVLPKGGR